MDISGQSGADVDKSSWLGAALLSNGVHFRVWAPLTERVEVLFETGMTQMLRRQNDGYFTGLVSSAGPADRYKLRLDGRGPFPDPASRFQPDGPHGWSEIIDEDSYAWSAGEDLWRGLRLPGQVIYELHIGAFTLEGTYVAAEREFARLRELGITILELMPLAEFTGHFGWGYDGVDFFAPFHHYGSPDDLRHMIDVAHQAGLAVILDVVYNHFGPDGNYLEQFSPHYASKHLTEWGNAVNFDQEGSEGVRDFFIQNAEYWIRDFHFDGLRLDATQSMQDSCRHGVHILTAITKAARTAAGERQIVILSECERQERKQIEDPEAGGFGIDGMWNDDFHHSAVVRLTAKREAYFSDHFGRAQEFVSVAKYGFLYQGQFYSWQNNPRGTPFFGVEPWHMVSFLENHDQVANTLFGTRPRLSSSPGRYRAMAAYWLMIPETPMFFMGQEFGSTRPFLYFADHTGSLREKVRKGRAEFLKQFDSLNTPDMESHLPNFAALETFKSCKLDTDERKSRDGRQLERMFRDLLHLRREDPALNLLRKVTIDGAVLTDNCFLLRYFLNENGGEEKDRLLIVNFGVTLDLAHLPEPLLAPPKGKRWACKWASERPEYGGSGVIFPVTEKGWRIAGESAMLLIPG